MSSQALDNDNLIDIFQTVHHESTTPRPLVLGQVCRQWREVAWSMPSLWQNMYLRFATPLVSHQVRLLQEWLERSNSLPLDVTMKIADTSAFNRAAPLLQPTISRWSSLKVLIVPGHSDDYPAEPLREMLEVQSQRNGGLQLTSFTVGVDSPSFTLMFKKKRPLQTTATKQPWRFGQINSKNLERIRIQYGDMSDYMVDWSRLHRVSVRFGLQDCLAVLLAGADVLREAWITMIEDPKPQPEDLGLIMLANNPPTVKYLHTLDLTIISERQARQWGRQNASAPALFNAFNFPALTHVSLDLDPTQSYPVATISRLGANLEQSQSSLQTFNIRANFIHCGDLIRYILLPNPSLRQFTWHSINGEGYLDKDMIDHLDLSTFIDSSNESLHHLEAAYTTKSPNLTSFEFSGVARIDLDALRRMLHSRAVLIAFGEPLSSSEHFTLKIRFSNFGWSKINLRTMGGGPYLDVGQDKLTAFEDSFRDTAITVDITTYTP